MSRYLIALLLLAATVSAHAVTPARESANGAGGTCPEAAASAVPAEETDVVETHDPANAKPESPGRSTKPEILTRPTRTGARWHSFLPGMFK